MFSDLDWVQNTVIYLALYGGVVTQGRPECTWFVELERPIHRVFCKDLDPV